jgi:hypothetical protein
MWTADLHRPNRVRDSGRVVGQPEAIRSRRLSIPGYAVIRIGSILNGRTNNSGGCRPPQPRIMKSKQVKREPVNWLPFVFAQPCVNCACSHWTATDDMVTRRPCDAKDFCYMRSRAETFSP